MRWSSWRALPIRRRASVSLAAMLLLVVAAWMVRTGSSPSTASPGPAAVTNANPQRARATPAFDASAAAARMRSEIARASAGQWVFLRGGPALAPGPAADFDGFRVTSPAVLRDDANRYQAWYRGCRLHGRSHDCAIGHATSTDGIEWKPDGTPALAPVDGADEFQLGGLAVVRTNGTYFLWYSLVPSAFRHRPTSPLYLATSSDGVRWQQHGRVFSGTEQIPWSIEPSALHDGRIFHLWFVDSLTEFEGHETRRPAEGPFLRHLTSSDGRTWQDVGQFPLAPIRRGRIHVSVSRERDGSFRAFYFGRMPDRTAAAVGWLTSPDGTNWNMATTTPVTARLLGDDVRGVVSAAALHEADGTRVWFVADRAGGRQDVRAAFLKDSE
jgi:hypothetical protein